MATQSRKQSRNCILASGRKINHKCDHRFWHFGWKVFYQNSDTFGGKSSPELQVLKVQIWLTIHTVLWMICNMIQTLDTQYPFDFKDPKDSLVKSLDSLELTLILVFTSNFNV